MKTFKLLLIFIICSIAADCLSAQIKIMPLGDSITYDNRINETRPIGQQIAYRQQLWLELQAAGYDVNFVGSQVAGQDAVPSFDPDNEGHPGYHADGGPEGRSIAPNIYDWLVANPADVILLHIGTNDISTGQAPAGIAAEIGQVLDNIDQYETDNGVKIWVILARIISRTDSAAFKTATTALNNQIQLMADTRIAGGDKIIVVDMESHAGLIYSIDTSAPYSGDMYDAFHPNVMGYEKMAAEWYDVGLMAIFPQAVAVAAQSVNEKTLVTLDGSGSVDPDAPAGVPLDYLWEQQSGTSIALSNPTAPKPTFTAPAVSAGGGTLTFKLTVTDADGFENSDTVSINVKNVLVPPSADAGPDQNVVAGRTVSLDGSQSVDPNGTIASVSWVQVSGKNQVTLTTPDKLTTEFTAPAVDPDGDVLTFELTVTDNDGLSSSDTVTVNVAAPKAPVADAGSDQNVVAGRTVTLNGSASYDPDGTNSVVQWEQISGKNQVTLTSPNELTTEFKAPAVDSGGDTLSFKLMITDIDGLESEDSVNVTIRPTAVSTANSNSGGSGGGGCFIQTVMN